MYDHVTSINSVTAAVPEDMVKNVWLMSSSNSSQVKWSQVAFIITSVSRISVTKKKDKHN